MRDQTAAQRETRAEKQLMAQARSSGTGAVASTRLCTGAWRRNEASLSGDPGPWKEDMCAEPKRAILQVGWRARPVWLGRSFLGTAGTAPKAPHIVLCTELRYCPLISSVQQHRRHEHALLNLRYESVHSNASSQREPSTHHLVSCCSFPRHSRPGNGRGYASTQPWTSKTFPISVARNFPKPVTIWTGDTARQRSGRSAGVGV